MVWQRGGFSGEEPTVARRLRRHGKCIGEEDSPVRRMRWRRLGIAPWAAIWSEKSRRAHEIGRAGDEISAE